MQFESRLVAADDDEIVDIGESAQPLAQWSGLVLPGFDTVRLATLHALLTGEPLHVTLDGYEPAYVSSDDVAVVRVGDELCASLVDLDDDAAAVAAAELAATEEFESAGWDEDVVADLLADLAGLAQLADAQDQALFLVIRPLEMTEE